jgi:hypothetical protein
MDKRRTPKRAFLLRHATTIALGIIISIASERVCQASDGTQQPKSLPIQFLGSESGALMVQWEDLQAGRAGISVLDNSPENKQQKIQATITPLYLPGDVIIPLSVNAAVPASPSDKGASLNRFQAMRFNLSVGSGPYKLQPGTYTAVVVFQDADTTSQLVPVIKQVQIVIPGIQPVVSKATLIAVRNIPFTTWWRGSVVIPLKFPSAASELPNIEPKQGIIRRDSGGSSTVTWRAIPDSSGRNAELSVESLPSAGRYEGEVNFGSSQDKNSTVTLSVVAKDFILWPILVTGFGILLAWGISRYTKVLRVVWTLRKQEADLGKSFAESQAKFSKATQDTPSRNYSIAADLQKQRRNLLALLSKIEAKWAPDLTTDDDYKEATSQLQSLEAAIAQWGQFGPALATLNDKLQQAESDIDASKVLLQGVGEPKLFSIVKSLLQGSSITIAALSAKMQDVQDKTKLLLQWMEANDEAKAATARLQDLPSEQPLTADQTSRRHGAETQLVTVWQHLWGGDLAAIDSVTASGGDLDTATAAIAQLEKELPRRERRVDLVSAPQAASVEELWGSLIIPSAARDLPASDTRRAALLRHSLWIGDRVATICALVIALLTGLSLKYFGQAFGTAEDYIGLFLWGAGTKATLDIITSIVGKFSSST